MKMFLAVALMGVFVTTANAATRCKEDWTGAVVCTDTGTGTVVVRCKEDWTGAVVCE